jgi:predicted enzyme related to lactoylglutathione lyase
VWFDYMTNEPAKAQALFAALLGWSTRTYTLPPRGDLHTRIVTGEHESGAYRPALPKAAIFRYSEPYTRWLPHFQVASIHDSIYKVRNLGGSIHVESHPVGDLGLLAIVADPCGATFGLWQPNAPADTPGWTGTPNTFCWAELYTPNVITAATFYKPVCGVSMTKTDMPDGRPYFMFEHDGQPRAGARHPMPDTLEGWFAWVSVANLEHTVARALQLGATAPVHGGGIALIIDPYGAMLGLSQAR